MAREIAAERPFPRGSLISVVRLFLTTDVSIVKTFQELA